MELKDEVRDFWDDASCGELYAEGSEEKQQYENHGKARYSMEPYILDFARFEEGAGKDVLEIGVGMGADHLEWAKSKPKSLTGVDLTPRAIEHTTKRFKIFGLESKLQVADAENLPFADNSFDIVYSWGVLHHSPNTPKAIEEVRRVLRPGGITRIMVYHKYSLTGYMLWIKYALLKGKPFTSLTEIYHKYLESPGTKAYTKAEAEELVANYSSAKITTMLCFGDLLEGEVGQRHKGLMLSLAKALWPRFIIKKLFKNHGLDLLIEAVK